MSFAISMEPKTPNARIGAPEPPLAVDPPHEVCLHAESASPFVRVAPYVKLPV